ncbi:MAG: ribosome small subunit-dependent GTPase A [Anaerolineae bacterium]
MQAVQGLVIRTHGGHYYVQVDQQVYDCTLRGKLKHERTTSDLVAIGDQVEILPAAGNQGTISRVLPRKSAFSRCPPPPRRPIEQVIIANPDQVLIVFAASSPPLNPLMLDRFLVACEAAHLPALIVINKVDEAECVQVKDLAALYRGIGYPVWLVSAVTGEGLTDLHAQLLNKLTVVVGPSGVGKSTLLNAWWPELQLEIGEISYYHDRGKHTTVVAELLHPEPSVFIADTPGLRQLRFWQVTPGNLEHLFIEFAPYLGDCYYEPCSHIVEPDCAVRAAVEHGLVSSSRYESYCRMYELGF